MAYNTAERAACTLSFLHGAFFVPRNVQAAPYGEASPDLASNTPTPLLPPSALHRGWPTLVRRWTRSAILLWLHTSGGHRGVDDAWTRVDCESAAGGPHLGPGQSPDHHTPLSPAETHSTTTYYSLPCPRMAQLASPGGALGSSHRRPGCSIHVHPRHLRAQPSRYRVSTVDLHAKAPLILPAPETLLLLETKCQASVVHRTPSCGGGNSRPVQQACAMRARAMPRVPQGVPRGRRWRSISVPSTPHAVRMGSPSPNASAPSRLPGSRLTPAMMD